MKSIFTASLTILITGNVMAQTVIQPNYGLKSHETLVINKIETTEKATTIFLNVENRRTGGTFCADKNIIVKYPDGTRTKMVLSSGIPACPDSYKFKAIGEKLSFSLVFPPLKTGTRWIDLIEDCNDNCFYFYGVILSRELNEKIDNAFSLAVNGEPTKALSSFVEILSLAETKNSGAEGLLYVNIIKFESDLKNTTEASRWYERLKSSGIPELQRYIGFLNDQGIKF